jgi:hypothetical protein
MRLNALRLLVFFLLIPLAVTLAAPLARTLCPQIVEQALTDLGANCGNLERNSACYGFNQVGATFTVAQADDFFSKVSDQTPLNIVDTVTTTPLDEASGTWGVAVMKVQANVPNSLPGQAVTFMLMGDTEVRNDVPPDEAFTPADPTEVIANGNVNIRSAPGTNANVLGSVSDRTPLLTDGRSEDGEWLRVTFNNAPGWVNAGLVIAPPEVSKLPTLTAAQRTPMQTFYVTTGVSEASCQEAPDVLVVQGPENIRVDLTINGADIQIGSTIALRSTQLAYGDLPFNTFQQFTDDAGLPAEMICNQTQLMVIDGQASVNNRSANLPAGFTGFSLNCGGADRASGLVTPWIGIRAMTPGELSGLASLNGIQGSFLNYPIEIPTTEEIQQLLVALSGGSSQGGASGPAAGQADCSRLRPTSPLGTMPGREVPFYWDAAPGATSYTVRVYDSIGTLVGEYSVNAPQTTTVGNPQGKDNLSWEVSAYVNGELACTSARVGVLRDTVYESQGTSSSGGGTYLYCTQGSPVCPSGCTPIGTCGFLSSDTLCECGG